MCYLDSGKYTSISKNVARQLFYEGKTIYLTPSNVAANKFNLWYKPVPIRNKYGNKYELNSFDNAVIEFEYRNCNYGYYANFWIIEEKEKKEEEEMTWTEIMDKARHLALYSGTFTDNPEEKADDVYLVKDIGLVVDAFAKDIDEGKLGSYSEPASFLDAHGIEWE